MKYFEEKTNKWVTNRHRIVYREEGKLWRT